MWRELIAELTPDATFSAPESAAALMEAEQALSQPIPPSLHDLLTETDGIRGAHGLGLVWNLDRIVSDNLQFRSNEDFARLYMPFKPLLFFADAGNGNQFAFLSPPVDRDDIFAWDHESDSRRWVASNLQTYLRWWLEGRIKL
jgi:SMI1/KNR4 family protein SUKH-1